eukprot:288136-Prymnesium_polylepis.2
MPNDSLRWVPSCEKFIERLLLVERLCPSDSAPFRCLEAASPMAYPWSVFTASKAHRVEVDDESRLTKKHVVELELDESSSRASHAVESVSYTHLRAHETLMNL